MTDESISGSNGDMHMKPDMARLQQLVNESERLATFQDWPVKFIKKEVLAKDGFYYRGPADSVVCIFCGLELGLWEEGDDPVEEHRKHNPHCKVHLQIDASKIRRPRGEDECGCLIKHTPRQRYLTLNARFDSFEDWPISMKQSKKEMAQAGFYYTGIGDKVMCFSCGIGIYQWEENDQPWVEHAKWNPSCEYVLREKGEDFVRDAVNEKLQKEEDEKKTVLEVKEHSAAEERLLCSVCKSEERTIVSVPCLHLATCKECNKNLTKCPICRTDEINALNVKIP